LGKQETRRSAGASGSKEEDLLRLPGYEGRQNHITSSLLIIPDGSSYAVLHLFGTPLLTCMLLSSCPSLLQRTRDDCVAQYGVYSIRFLTMIIMCHMFGSSDLKLKTTRLFSEACLPEEASWCAGPDSERCQKLIEAHKQCLRSEGFNVRSCHPSIFPCLCVWQVTFHWGATPLPLQS
jgi:hypothetical protein